MAVPFPRSTRLVGCAVALFALAGCKTTPKMDLAENEALYRPTGYRSQVPVDREVFVTPCADERAPIEEASSKPTVFADDGRWARPPASMLDDLIRRELESGALFKEVATQPKPATLILMPSIVNWRGGITEEVTGRASFAQVGLRLVVRGPADASGERKTLFDEQFAHVQASETAMIPRSPLQLFGMATRSALAKALAALDQSNVARSMVPLDR